MKFNVKTLVNHPFTFAVGTGIANGLLAKARNKKIDIKTAVTLGSIIGIGETALVMYEPPSERGEIMEKMSLFEIGLWSCGGLFVGLMPFVTWRPVEHGERAKPPLIAAVPPEGATANTAVGGYARPRRRVR